MKITGIYLAAGKGTRMGRDKLSLPLGNHRLGMWALEKAIQSHLDKVIVISTQTNHSLFTSMVDNKLMISPLKNELNKQSDSIKAGLDFAILLQSDAVIIILADQPFITSAIINQLIEVYKRDPTKLFVAASFKGNMRPPILISKKLFNDIYTLEGDQGAKKILMNKRHEGILVPFFDGKIFEDIDRMDEYLYWKGIVDSMY